MSYEAISSALDSESETGDAPCTSTMLSGVARRTKRPTLRAVMGAVSYTSSISVMAVSNMSRTVRSMESTEKYVNTVSQDSAQQALTSSSCGDDCRGSIAVLRACYGGGGEEGKEGKDSRFLH